MYCIKCGVELGDAETSCPLCKTRVYHPDLPCGTGEPTYPRKAVQPEEYNVRGILFVITIVWALILVLPSVFDFFLHGEITWSGYAAGGVLLGYICLILPTWFRRANPVIFVPCDFAAAALYLLYIDLTTGGGWFLSFAFPVTGGLCIIVSAVIALCRYVRRGYLYIFGGGLIALGAWTVLIELMLHVTFHAEVLHASVPVYWSPFSAAVLAVLGMMLIVIAIVKPLRESLRKMFFLG